MRMRRMRSEDEESENPIQWVGKTIFSDIARFPTLFPFGGAQDGSQEGPRSHQEGSKRVPAVILNRIYFLLRFLINLGSVLGAILDPKWPTGVRS